jgi:hypothetical protein
MQKTIANDKIIFTLFLYDKASKSCKFLKLKLQTEKIKFKRPSGGGFLFRNPPPEAAFSSPPSAVPLSCLGYFIDNRNHLIIPDL